VPQSGPLSRHILIYGPPAAGKLTVARGIADRFGFRLLDNHVVGDAALRLFTFADPQLEPLVQTLRATLFQAAAESGIDVVSTLSTPISDETYLQRLTETCKGHGSAMTIVQLVAERAVLERRVAEPSRKGTNKLQRPAHLGRLLDELDLSSTFAGTNLTIDNTDLSVDAVVQLIADHAGIGPTSKSTRI
jgi:shikimate kinase